ncbi:TonB-dependent siderophore receptor [Affinibrenneria salicis]|uniref:TonB-dependent siderophore receptor n=2 Tax=Affinibrenneria salicis TaxID=2590031 RepID=A0A5J5FU83_9GAMM|nr:TonB-dependent siderophore receptor [Affinibrenneria salicis]
MPIVAGAWGLLLAAGAANAADSGDTITVNAGANAAGSAADDPSASGTQKATLGVLGKRDLLNTPYAVQAVPQAVIVRQQAKSLKDIYKYLPSVQGDGARPQTRGVQGSVVQNSMIDGLNVVSTTDYPAEQFQQIEVLNGLGGSLYGPANPAGMFNFVSKRPGYSRKNSVTLGMGTGLSGLGALDLGGPLDDGERVRYRLNLLNEQGGSYASGSKKRRQLASLALDFQLSDQTVLESNFSYYHYLEKGLPGSFALASGVAYPRALNPTQRNLGQTYAGNDNHTTTASFHLKHDFDGNWQSDIGVLHQVADRESTAVTNTLINNQGDYKTTVSSATASRFIINSYMATLNGSVNTGWLQHDLALGMRGFVWKNYNPQHGGTSTLGSGNLSNLQSFAEPDYPDFTNRYHSATSTQQAFSLADTLTFSPQWSLLLAGSESFLTSANYAQTHQRTSASNDSGFSGSASLMYKPVENLTLYTTYADSLQQGDTAPATSSNAGQITAPYRSKQIEVGSKLRLGQTNLSAALFQIERPFAYTRQDGLFAMDGSQRNRGLELMADGDVSRDVHLYGGVTLLEPKLRDTATAASRDKQIVGLSRVTANLLAVWNIPVIEGLDLDANVHYVGRRPTDNANDNWVGSYALFDVGSRYRTRLFHTNTTFRLDLTNLTNRHYWTNIVPGGLNGYSGAGNASAQLGAPRMAQVSMQIEF